MFRSKVKSSENGLQSTGYRVQSTEYIVQSTEYKTLKCAFSRNMIVTNNLGGVSNHMNKFSISVHSTVYRVQTTSVAQWLSDFVTHCSMIQWLSDSMTQWLSDSETQWLSNSVTQWLSGSVVQWFSDSVIQWLSDTVNQWLSVCVRVLDIGH